MRVYKIGDARFVIRKNSLPSYFCRLRGESTSSWSESADKAKVFESEESANDCVTELRIRLTNRQRNWPSKPPTETP